MSSRPLGDMDPEAFRREGHRVVDWLADYLAAPEHYPVLSRSKPGDLLRALPATAPEHGESFDAIFADFEQHVVPGLTHWNHPGFFAYFAISTSGPGILAEMLSAGLNVQAMLWRTSPAATELEEVTLRWLAQLIHLPSPFEGVIYDTASISTLHALAAARETVVPDLRVRGMLARPDVAAVRVYCSEHTHSSIDKAVLLLGLGQQAIRRIPVDRSHAMRADQLAAAIAADRRDGVRPLAVIATIGTTSSTAVDPVDAIADACEAEGVWLHVDAAYAGVMAMVPAWRKSFAGLERADSVVVNPHKWLFTPFDLSVLFCRRMDVLRQAFALVPEYLRTADPPVKNLMDTGIQLGRRFRALKLWMVLRYFGSEGIRARLEAHVDLARAFASWIDDAPGWERLAPVPFSVVCFRYHPGGVDDEDTLERVNAAILDRVNTSGEAFLSHTKLDGRYTLRLAIGNIRTEERHARRAWDLLSSAAKPA